MARRKRTGLAEDVIELVAMLPWWAGVLLAVVAYLAISPYAATPPRPGSGAGAAGAAFAGGAIYALASVLRYLLPALLLIGALISAIKHRKRATLADNVTKSESADALTSMTWHEFEMLVGESFRRSGFEVEETGGGGADGGVDLVLTKDGEKFLVQCKQWRAFKVGVDVVRDLYGAMAASGAAGGFVVTSGRFTEEAKAFASGRNVRLLDGPQLTAMLKMAKGPTAPSAPTPFEPRLTPAAWAAPVCRTCGSGMERRTAKKGQSAGSEFWGCTRFPACRGTRSI